MSAKHWIVMGAAVLAFTATDARGQAAGPAASGAGYYRVEAVAGPEGVDPQVGALAFLPDGRLVVCFHAGEVYFYDPATAAWQRFAEGLLEPLGVLPVAEDEVLVMQKPELTRLKDTDGDGRADVYETVTDDFGFSGNYHEFAYGPVADDAGNLYISLNTASTGAGILKEIRGPFRSPAATRDQVERAKYPNKMYAVVPYRGWVLQVTPDGRTVPFAAGLRSPNGLVVDGEGRLFVTDNQGDWLGTSKLYHVEQDHFYGHPVSLAWREGWRGDPLQRDPRALDAMRTRAVVAFPHEVMAKSPTQPVIVPEGVLGPFAGQMIVGEMNEPRLLRVMLEDVGGALQGAAVPFLDGPALGPGNNRLAFAPDGSLWVGKTHLKWAGGEGLARITWTGAVPMDVQAMTLTTDGVELAFTRPLDAATARRPEAYRLRRYYYKYHGEYGSDPTGVAAVDVTSVELLPDGQRVRLALADLQPGYIYELTLDGVRAADGSPVQNPLLTYTLNRLLDGSAPVAGFGVPDTGGTR
jgi:glucose/arabinose dehydrogenase